jgi:sporulation protein YlmC with PRC-barrel domain
MKTMRLRNGSAAAAVLLLAPAIALAQTQQPAPAAGQQQQQRPAQAQQAGQCSNDLQAFGGQMEEDGFWLSGARQGIGWYGMGPAAPGMAGGAAPGMVSRSGAPAATRPATGGGATARAPFAGMDWQVAPTQALRTLYGAAHVLAQNGSEQACQTVLRETRDLYAAYTAQLRQAGVEPGDVRSWRQSQLALARPVTEQARGLRADAITGTDLRNPRDENLGSVEDVVFDPRTGQIAYVIVGRGGFLGIGRDHVAVPWQQLRATPSFDTFVLDISEDRMDAAPTVDPDSFATDEGYERRRGEIESYWRAG